jgi:hypothetical protein
MFAGVVGMAFDGGPCWEAYLLVWGTLSYPVSLVLAVTLRKRLSAIIYLPALNIIVVLFCSSLANFMSGVFGGRAH